MVTTLSSVARHTTDALEGVAGGGKVGTADQARGRAGEEGGGEIVAVNTCLGGDDPTVIAGVSKLCTSRVQGTKGVAETTELESKGREGGCGT